MTDKHTPGPWFVRQRKHVIEIDNSLESPDYRHITNGLPWQDGGPTDEHGVSLQVLADARLIATAPELLKALEELTPRDWSLNDPMRFKYGRGRAAIKAAKGDTS